MLVLGFTGGLELISEERHGYEDFLLHDAACVLVEDGKVVCGIEEERLNRIKHTNKFPLESLHFCLKTRGIQLQDIDLIAFYSSIEYSQFWLKILFLNNPQLTTIEPKVLFQNLFRRGLGSEIDPDKLCFVPHHHAHAMSAAAVSGYESSLIVTLDGWGDNSSGTVFDAKGTVLEQLADFPIPKSLGNFYLNVISFLGYSQFDEYKVMGLAPYGNPEKYRDLFKTFYTLLPNGDYEIEEDRIISLFDLGIPRRKGEPFTQIHKDIAASLQEALEDIAFHLIKYQKQQTNHKNLCLAGGVAHNCTLNGKILRSGMFENVFVQPASHDAGCALGAALYAYYQANPTVKSNGLEHVYWGTDIGNSDSIFSQLIEWQDFIAFEKLDNVCEQTARLIADGCVVGWVQGNSEFGPRALGNRSILGDPRPEENKTRINKMIKKREGYRPFAPSVLEEDVDQFFEVPHNQKQLPFMIFVVNVREDKRQILGAVTHIDGTARIQTVSQKTNKKYWNLINSFKQLTGVPILLNTSFNNNVEPIVDSVEDAIVCFLTTGLDYTVIGDYLLRKKDISYWDHMLFRLFFPPQISLHQVQKFDSEKNLSHLFYIKKNYDNAYQREVSAKVFDILKFANTEKTIGDILNKHGDMEEEDAKEVIHEIIQLWSERLIILRP